MKLNEFVAKDVKQFQTAAIDSQTNAYDSTVSA